MFFFFVFADMHHWHLMIIALHYWVLHFFTSLVFNIIFMVYVLYKMYGTNVEISKNIVTYRFSSEFYNEYYLII